MPLTLALAEPPLDCTCQTTCAAILGSHYSCAWSRCSSSHPRCPLPPQCYAHLHKQEVDDATSPYIQDLLRKTAEKKDERKQERLDDYYRRNFKVGCLLAKLLGQCCIISDTELALFCFLRMLSECLTL